MVKKSRGNRERPPKKEEERVVMKEIKKAEKKRPRARNPRKEQTLPGVEAATSATIKQSNSGVGRGIGNLAGLAAGLIPGVGPIIAPFISSLLGEAGNSIENMIVKGHGKYELHMADGSVMQVDASGPTTTLQFCEYLGDVFTGADPGEFNVTSFSINGGLHRAFPWGQQVCNAYTIAQYLQYGVELKSNISPMAVGAGPEIGRKCIAFEYNSTRTQPFANMEEMQQADSSQTCRADQDLEAWAECDKTKSVKRGWYVLRSGPPPAGNTLLDFDPFVLSVGTIGMSGEGVLNTGSLFAVAKIALSRKTMINVARALKTDLFNLTNPESGDMLKAATAVANPDNTFGCRIRPTSVGYIDLPPNPAPGDYLVSYCTTGISPAAANTDITVGPISFTCSEGVTQISDTLQFNGQPNTPVSSPDGFMGTLTTAGFDPSGLVVTVMLQFRFRINSGLTNGWIRLQDTQTVRPWEAAYAYILITPISKLVGYNAPDVDPLKDREEYWRLNGSICDRAHSMRICLAELDAAQTRERVANAVYHLRGLLISRGIKPSTDEVLACCSSVEQKAKLKNFNFGEKQQNDYDERLDMLTQAVFGMMQSNSRMPAPNRAGATRLSKYLSAVAEEDDDTSDASDDDAAPSLDAQLAVLHQRISALKKADRERKVVVSAPGPRPKASMLYTTSVPPPVVPTLTPATDLQPQGSVCSVEKPTLLRASDQLLGQGVESYWNNRYAPTSHAEAQSKHCEVVREHPLENQSVEKDLTSPTDTESESFGEHSF
jgi:hypothetical protein